MEKTIQNVFSPDKRSVCQGLLLRHLSSAPKVPPKDRNEVQPNLQEDVHSYVEQEMESKDVFRVLGRYLWPDDHPEVKKRVLISLALLGAGKLLNVQVCDQKVTKSSQSGKKRHAV